MAKGNLKVGIADLAGAPLRGKVEIDLDRFSGESGAGGESLNLSVNMGAANELTITGITCRIGPGTRYVLTFNTPHFRTYSFFQLIRENIVNVAADDVEFWVKEKDVKDIRAPKFDELPGRVRANLNRAEMIVDRPEDQDLAGKSGEALYKALGPLRKACMLNIVKKASHATSDQCFPSIGRLLICRQDRFFAMVDASLPAQLRKSERYKSAPDDLHEPLKGFEMIGESFKTRDAHANLQVTFQRNLTTGELAADIDIDESSGIQHGLEVIKNAVSGNRTNPYLIREFMQVADPLEHTLDPGYQFTF